MTGASLGIQGLLEGPTQPAELLWAGPAALYLAVGDAVLAVVGRGGVALPNAVVVDGPLPAAGPATVGSGLVRVGAWTAAPASWWDPRPFEGLSGGGRLTCACSSLPDKPPVRVGRGPGLTPEDDDVLAGAVATLVALGHPDAAPLWAEIEPQLERTTALSAALLRHAALGEMCRPAARYLEALCGQGDKVRAERRLCSVGHTSGAALARGIRWAVGA